MTEATMPFRGHETWYRVVGDLGAEGRIPAVICHGGPGAGHDYTEPIAGLLGLAGRGSVLYDQLGCGNSTLLPDAPADLWTPELFMDELVALTEHLGIAERYVVVGQSWGGMLAMQHAITHPAGLRAIVVADSPASMRLWVEEANGLRELLPPDVQATLLHHEAAGTTDDPAYAEAVEVFYARHLCRIPKPDCLLRTEAQIARNPTVYHTMNGPSEFHVVGSLTGWDITDRLHEIAVPTLLVSGAYDEATPRIVGEIDARIPGVRWELFEWSSHLPHLEEPARFAAVVNAFLAEVDGA